MPLIIIILCVIIALVSPYDPVQPDFLSRLALPSFVHPLGTDHLGRDMLSRIAHGAIYSLGLAFLIVSIGAIVGIALGIVAGYAGKKLDYVLMRFTDSFFAFPEIIAAIAMASILGPGTRNMVIALALVSWMKFARLARTLTVNVLNKDFILQAELNGLPKWMIFKRHILPNIFMNLLVLWTNAWSRTILTISGLSFIGLGVQPPNAEWGAMLLDGKSYMFTHPWIMIFPGIAVLVSVLSINIMGDRLRDRLDTLSYK
ncbi:ABC transporter permease [Curvivirga sp.]|uniref:ABC transporter permease n=1 Tax=Curvivirga sp. TaxID=2856848 RepID=UPI003B5BE8FD